MSWSRGVDSFVLIILIWVGFDSVCGRLDAIIKLLKAMNGG